MERMDSWRRFRTTVLDFVFPRMCCACGNRIEAAEENGLCWDCRAEGLPLAPPWCERCGGAVAGRVDHAFTCSDCENTPPSYDRARSLYRYEGGVRTAIHALKYRRDFSVVPDLSRLLLAGLRAHVPDPGEVVCVPVPLHPSRFRRRGFNQGMELIRGMRRLDPEVRVWNGCRRVKKTDSQTHLSKAARRRNVSGAFRVPERKGAAPVRLVLIDDVMTTGATLDAAAKALRRAGAEEIHTLTVARG